ncbi:MAG: leucine-rich repeat protein [Lachnospiraceae bacterium]|nr:leucine-rich repeat protein [Lachnospiraceae bacterium]
MKKNRTFTFCDAWQRVAVLTVLMLLLVYVGFGSVSIKADDQTSKGINVKTPSQMEIKKRISSIKDLKTEYKENPDFTAPYAAGSLTDATLQNAVDWVNACRFIAGIPDNVTLDDNYTKLTQASSIVNYINETLSHYPEKPNGMDDDLFNLGYEGSSSSNIARGSGKYLVNGTSVYSMIVHCWMDDGDSKNISKVGHRRWILNPSMQKTGFGCVWGDAGSYGGSYFSAIYATDNAFGKTDNYGVAWPAQNMPISFFESDYPWSISMGYDVPDDTKVTLTRQSDGKSWNFSKGSTDFYTENSNYGQKGCIIFRPSGISSYNHGDVFEVVITGTGLDVKYYVNFFDPDKISDSPTKEPTKEPTPGPTKEPTKEPTKAPSNSDVLGDVSGVSFSYTDIRSNKTVKFSGSDGTPKVLVLGGVGSCANTMNCIGTLSKLYGQVDGKLEIYTVDIVENTEATIKGYLSDNNIVSDIHCASLESFDPNYKLYSTVLGMMDTGDGWWTMPAVLYINGKGEVLAKTLAYQKPDDIKTDLSKIVSFKKETTPAPTKEPTKTPTPEPTKEVTPEPTKEVTPEPTKKVTPEPTKEVTPEPTKTPTNVPTQEIPQDKGELYGGEFSFKDASTSSSATLNLGDGTKKIIVISDLMNCWYTMDILDTINSQVSGSDIQLFMIDTKGTSADTLSAYLENYYLDGEFYCTPEKKLNASGNLSWDDVKQKIFSAAGIKSSGRRKNSYVTPLIAYVDGSGNIVKTTTGYVDYSDIQGDINILNGNGSGKKPGRRAGEVAPVISTKTAKSGEVTQTVLLTDVKGAQTLTVTKASESELEELKFSINGKKAKLVLFATEGNELTVPGYVKLDGKKYYVKYVSKLAYGNNESVSEVTFGKYVSKIYKNAFKGMKQLSVININGAKLKSVGKNAFKGIAKNAVFNISGTDEQFNNAKELIIASGVAKTVTFNHVD